MFADRSRWREFAPACLLAMVLSISSDIIVVSHYKLWTYHDPTGWILQKSPAHFFDDLGIYPVVTYLFLQYYPAAKNRLHKVAYFFYWTTGAILLEFLHHLMGWMGHTNGWTHWHSYVSDWLLLFVLLLFHQVYNRQVAQVDNTSPNTTQVPGYVQFIRSMGMDWNFSLRLRSTKSTCWKSSLVVRSRLIFTKLENPCSCYKVSWNSRSTAKLNCGQKEQAFTSPRTYCMKATIIA